MRPLLAGYLALLTALTAAVIAGGLILARDDASGDAIAAIADDHAHDVVAWEIQHFPEKWAYRLATLFEGGRSEAEEDELVARYFRLSDEIRDLERSSGDGGRLSMARDERRAIENDVEQALENRIGDLLRDEGFVMNPPLFSDIDLLFPPVDFELDSPPKLLTVSPRDRIELDRSYLLTPGLELGEVEEIESETEANGVSALVVNTGGVATYPSVLPESASYESIVETAIHEWLHQYLFFYPLGSSYYDNDRTRTLNETVASMLGQELGAAFLQRHPGPERPAPPTPEPSDFDFTAEMRALRQEVERLLAAGRIEEAERLMDEKRDEFEAEGFYIRRLNQAYFAFNGFYADSAGSIDPIGPKLAELRERSETPFEFVRAVRGITSEEELDRLLAGS